MITHANTEAEELLDLLEAVGESKATDEQLHRVMVLSDNLLDGILESPPRFDVDLAEKLSNFTMRHDHLNRLNDMQMAS